MQMESHTHTLSSLFDQLGLDNKNTSVENFIDINSGIPGNVKLHKAGFWNASQASFLKQMKDEDADWAGIIDQLDIMLR
jgi:hypothetical protein